jgi:hypothetical protein
LTSLLKAQREAKKGLGGLTAEAQPAQHRWQRIGWLLYLSGYCLMAGGYPSVDLVVFA